MHAGVVLWVEGFLKSSTTSPYCGVVPSFTCQHEEVSMSLENRNTNNRLKHLMLRSQQLHCTLESLLEGPFSDDSEHAEMALNMCVVTLEQAAAVRALAAAGLSTAAACMLRSQCKTVTSAAWLAYTEDDNLDAVSRLLARLKEGGASLERPLPSAKAMIDEIRRKVSGPVGESMHNDLARMNTVTWHTEHSFMYGGINQCIMSQEIKDVDFAAQLIDHSNSLMSITGVILEQLHEGGAPSLNG